MPGEKFESNRTFLYVVGGNLRQQVEEGTRGAVIRKFETSSGQKGEKTEIVFKNWTGRIKDLVIRGSDFGEQLNVVFEDATLQLNCNSRYFIELIKKLMNADINSPVTISPYDFESNGKRRMGITVIQQYQKLTSYYDRLKDDNTWETINDFPIPEGGGQYFSKDDWKIYFLKVKKFMMEETEKLRKRIEKKEVATDPTDPIDEEPEKTDKEEFKEQNHVQDDTEIPVAADKAQDDEVRIEDIPF